jgi:hypothetical protein
MTARTGNNSYLLTYIRRSRYGKLATLYDAVYLYYFTYATDR